MDHLLQETNLAEVVTAVVVFVKNPLEASNVDMYPLIFFRIFWANIRLNLWLTHTPTHTHFVPVCLWSNAAADRISKHLHSLKNTHGHAHAPLSTAALLLKGS